MSLNEGERLQPLISKPPPARSWPEMFVAWTGLLDSLCAIVGAHAGVPMIGEASIAVWRWMLSFPQCNEARKAAYTLGAAAFWIERWRKACVERASDEICRRESEDAVAVDPVARAFASRLDRCLAVGRRAEEMVRRAGWHVSDAQIEARSVGLDADTPAIYRCPSIRLYAYSQAVDPEHGGVNFCGVMNDSDRRRVTLAMLDDFVRHASERKTLKPSDDALIALAPALVDTLGASLPDGPWIVTSQDVWRFLAELLLEDAV